MIGVAKVNPRERTHDMNGVHDMGGMQSLAPFISRKRMIHIHMATRWGGEDYALSGALRPWRNGI